MQQTSTQHTCLVCGSANVVHSFNKREVDYLTCKDCGFRFATPDKNANLENSISDFEEAYITYLSPDQADDKNFDDLARWMGRFTPMQNVTLLDVGCGGGKLVRYFRGKGIDATGLEPCRALYDHFLAKDPFYVSGDLDVLKSQQPGRQYDVVTSFDVIEHTENPVTFLHGLVEMVKPGGVLFLSCPDVGSPTAKVLGKWWHHYNRYHLSYLNKHTARRIAEREGLELLHFSRRGRYRSLGYAVRYLFDFGAGLKPPKVVSKLDGIYIPINPFDTMFLALKKKA